MDYVLADAYSGLRTHALQRMHMTSNGTSGSTRTIRRSFSYLTANPLSVGTQYLINSENGGKTAKLTSFTRCKESQIFVCPPRVLL